MTDETPYRFRDAWQGQIQLGRLKLQAPLDRSFVLWTGLSGIVLLALAALIAAIWGPQAGFQTLNAWGALAGDRTWSILTALGDTAVALAALLFILPRNFHLALIVLLSTFLGLAVTHGLKALIPLPRPGMVLDPDTIHAIGTLPDSASFPSGHSLTGAMLAAIYMLVARAPWQRLVLLLVGLAIAASRVFVGVHWPVDVLTGAALGLLATLAACALARLWPKGVNSAICLVVLALSAVSAVLLLLGHPAAYPLADPVTRILGAAALVIGLGGIAFPGPTARVKRARTPS